MSLDEIRSRYQRLADACAAPVAAVPADKWDAQSPCEVWTARDVVKHVAEAPAMIFGRVGRDFDASAAGGHPAAAFAATRAQIEAALGDDASATTEFDGFFGRTTFAESVDDFINFDLVIHRWELAK